MPNLPTLKNSFKKTLSLIALCGVFACSETPPEKSDRPPEGPERKEEPKIVGKDSNLTEPVVHIEELDQYQDYYKIGEDA